MGRKWGESGEKLRRESGENEGREWIHSTLRIVAKSSPGYGALMSNEHIVFINKDGYSYDYSARILVLEDFGRFISFSYHCFYLWVSVYMHVSWFWKIYWLVSYVIRGDFSFSYDSFDVWVSVYMHVSWFWKIYRLVSYVMRGDFTFHFYVFGLFCLSYHTCRVVAS